MKLILVRHGETDWLKERRYQGSTDVPLNPKGLKQARALARFLKHTRPAAIYISELKRTLQTAQPLLKIVKQKPCVEARLNEISFGRWEGYSYAEVEHLYGEAVRRWYTPKRSSKPHGGESFKSLDLRTGLFLEDLMKKHKNAENPCIIIAHGGPIRMILVRLFYWPMKTFWDIRIDPASISVVDIHRERNEIMLLNGQGHLKKLTSFNS